MGFTLSSEKRQTHLFSSWDMAYAMAHALCAQFGGEPIAESFDEAFHVVEPMMRFHEGQKVQLGGGPSWTIARITEEEVHIIPPEGGGTAVWKRHQFIEVWQIVEVSRFDRLGFYEL